MGGRRNRQTRGWKYSVERQSYKVMIAVDSVEWKRNTFCTSHRFVPDTDFRLQLTAVFQLLRGSTQSPGDCSYIIASSGTLHFLFYPIISVTSVIV